MYISTAEADKYSKRELKDVNAKAADTEQSNVRAAAGKERLEKSQIKFAHPSQKHLEKKNAQHRSQC